ncbi:uncharacterized protein GGS22DRAFT_198805 [Annulohypoxylon maeteangense]|uniref:uncharacterized protein n=1 Tax=Annulohypoxylon maeteangense TaxID=1927788 RepID=UPI002007F63F|nr:uncharacterized protein GGS22DRAFT_198805 [Annulohypoxylon maeteangense]KAI0887580.1 hypothetical protein GGS22DRAFT_198805 [Annulohypoxylon maeteangense]
MCQFVLIEYRCGHSEITTGPICQPMFIRLAGINIDTNSWTIEGFQRLQLELPAACIPNGQNTTRVVSNHWCGWECENTFYVDLASAASSGRLITQQLAALGIGIQGVNGTQILSSAPPQPQIQSHTQPQIQSHSQAQVEDKATVQHTVSSSTQTVQVQNQNRATQTQAQGPRSSQTQTQVIHPRAKVQAQAQTQAQAQPKMQVTHPIQDQAKMQVTYPIRDRAKTEAPKSQPQEAKTTHAMDRSTQPQATWPPSWLPAMAPASDMSSISGRQDNSSRNTPTESYGSGTGSGRSDYTGPGNGLLNAIREHELDRARDSGAGTGNNTGVGNNTGTGNYTGIGNYTGTGNSTSTGSNTGYYTGNQAGSHTGSHTGTGNRTGNYMSNYPGSYTSNYTGSHTGNYTSTGSHTGIGSHTGAGSYTGTGSYGNYTGTGGYGNYTSTGNNTGNSTGGARLTGNIGSTRNVNNTSDASRIGTNSNNAPYYHPGTESQPYYYNQYIGGAPTSSANDNGMPGNGPTYPQSISEFGTAHRFARIRQPHTQPRGAPLGTAGTSRMGTETQDLTNAQREIMTRRVRTQLSPTPHSQMEDEKDDHSTKCDDGSDSDDSDDSDDRVLVTMSAENMADGDVFN